MLWLFGECGSPTLNYGWGVRPTKDLLLHPGVSTHTCIRVAFVGGHPGHGCDLHSVEPPDLENVEAQGASPPSAARAYVIGLTPWPRATQAVGAFSILTLAIQAPGTMVVVYFLLFVASEDVRLPAGLSFDAKVDSHSSLLSPLV